MLQLKSPLNVGDDLVEVPNVEMKIGTPWIVYIFSSRALLEKTGLLKRMDSRPLSMMNVAGEAVACAWSPWASGG